MKFQKGGHLGFFKKAAILDFFQIVFGSKNVAKGRVQKKIVILWSLTITGGGVSPNHTLIAKLHCFFKHYIHLQLYSICSCT